jgi:hypothetical protein
MHSDNFLGLQLRKYGIGNDLVFSYTIEETHSLISLYNNGDWNVVLVAGECGKPHFISRI